MRPLLTLSARWVLISCSLVASIALFGGLVRLLPWLLSREVPFAISLPFAELLAARGAEVATLVGVPVGIGIATALFVERGEARALSALGVGPSRLAAGFLPLGLAALFVASAVAWTLPLDAPARLGARLVSAGRAACEAHHGARRADVPLLSLTWLCFDGGPRLVGAVPGLRQSLWFSASRLALAAETSELELDDLELAGATESLGLALHARAAHVSGLVAPGRRNRLSGGRRGLVTGLTALATAWASAWAILRARATHPLAAAAAAAAAALAAVAIIRVLDDRHLGITAYIATLPLGALSAVSLQGLAGWVLRWRIAGRKA
ncbi:MAG TPA: hypothetical protein VH062_34305 [Polyangiaceae bacterium]|jgi:hypothetical protein|nr:hypothetical protein [Polyangiaceae bacterium]